MIHDGFTDSDINHERKEYLIIDNVLLSDVNQLKTLLLIQCDAATLLSLIKTEHDSYVVLGLLPYYSLFYVACDDFLRNHSKLPMRPEIAHDIRTIRNHIKDYSDSFTKISRRLREIDEKKDIEFKESILFDFLKDPIFYYNLGIQFDIDNHPVTNTYTISSYVGNDGKKCFEVAKELGSYINSVYTGLSQNLPECVIERPRTRIRIPYYYDTNTHKADRFFLRSTNIDENLLLITLVCNVNFVLYILNGLLGRSNSFLFRIKYVVAHHATIALDRLRKHLLISENSIIDINKLSEICDEAKQLANPILRNCMMHYQFPPTRSKSQDIDMQDPLLGLANDCGITEGLSIYSTRIDKLLVKISIFLESMMDLKGIRLELF